MATKKELEKRIEKLEEQLQEEKQESSREENNEEEISRRSFLKKIGIGTAGLGALALTPASALNIRTSNDFTYTGSGKQYFKINNGGPVEVRNTNLDLNGNEIKNASNLNSGTSEEKTLAYEFVMN